MHNHNLVVFCKLNIKFKSYSIIYGNLYEIAQVISTTTLVLRKPYMGDSITTGSSATYSQSSAAAWFNDGRELIRHRAKREIYAHLLKTKEKKQPEGKGVNSAKTQKRCAFVDLSECQTSTN